MVVFSHLELQFVDVLSVFLLLRRVLGDLLAFGLDPFLLFRQFSFERHHVLFRLVWMRRERRMRRRKRRRRRRKMTRRKNRWCGKNRKRRRMRKIDWIEF